MKLVDARGHSCPIPVVMARKAVLADNPGELEILVDNQCAVENVTRFGTSQGYQVAVETQGEDFRLTLTRL